MAGYFRIRGYMVDRAAEGSEGLAHVSAEQSDVLIVDRLLPRLDGLAVVEMLRRAGGNDHLGKPFALAELAARVEALRCCPVHGTETLLRVGPLELNLVTRMARRGERGLELLPREFRMLGRLPWSNRPRQLNTAEQATSARQP